MAGAVSFRGGGVISNILRGLALPVVFVTCAAAGSNKTEREPANSAPVLWRFPEDISSRNLFYGQGGRPHEPHGTVTFEEEDTAGTNPKFIVRDSTGVKWTVKLGREARPETVASRLVWA